MTAIENLAAMVNNKVYAETGSVHNYRFAGSSVRQSSNYREYGRVMHGFKKRDEEANNVTSYKDDSPIYNILKKGQDATIKINNDPNRIIVVKAQDILDYQKDATVYYNENAISPQKIKQIQQYKEKAKVSGGGPKDLSLESVASYMVARGEVPEYITTDGMEIKNAKGNNETLKRVVYYACFPKLNKGSADFQTFCYLDPDPQDPTKPAGVIKPEQKEALKQKFKDILAMQIAVATANNEALDIVTPNAFFAGLKNKQDGRDLFAAAVIELAQEFDPKSKNPGKTFPGLFVHDENITNSLKNKNTKFSVVYNAGDAGAPAKVAKEKKLDFTVATCLMGEALGAAGNGAFGKYGNQAMEEDLTRRSVATLISIFSPKFNANLLDDTKYQKIGDKCPQVSPLAQAQAQGVTAGMSSMSSGNDDGRATYIKIIDPDTLQLQFANTEDAKKFRKAFEDMPGLIRDDGQLPRTRWGVVDIDHVDNNFGELVGFEVYKTDKNEEYVGIYLNDNKEKLETMKNLLPPGLSLRASNNRALSIGTANDLKQGVGVNPLSVEAQAQEVVAGMITGKATYIKLTDTNALKLGFKNAADAAKFKKEFKDTKGLLSRDREGDNTVLYFNDSTIQSSVGVHVYKPRGASEKDVYLKFGTNKEAAKEAAKKMQNLLPSGLSFRVTQDGALSIGTVNDLKKGISVRATQTRTSARSSGSSMGR